MSILYRIDSRLVHGQTLNYWCDIYKINKIIISNDLLSKDELKQLFYKIAISNEVDLEFLGITETMNYDFDNGTNYMVVYEGTKDVMRFLQTGATIKKLFISNSNSINREISIEGVYLSSEDIKDINIFKESYGIDIVYGTGN